jgi:hypothetical protein
LQDNILTPIEMHVFFVGLHEKTQQQTHLRVQRYHQNKDRTASPFVQTPHNEGTSTQQSGTPDLFNTCVQPIRTRVNFVLCIVFYVQKNL